MPKQRYIVTDESRSSVVFLGNFSFLHHLYWSELLCVWQGLAGEKVASDV